MTIIHRVKNLMNGFSIMGTTTLSGNSISFLQRLTSQLTVLLMTNWLQGISNFWNYIRGMQTGLIAISRNFTVNTISQKGHHDRHCRGIELTNFKWFIKKPKTPRPTTVTKISGLHEVFFPSFLAFAKPKKKISKKE